VTWPTVTPNQRCGAGSLGALDANGVPRQIVQCGLCVHWYSPEGGLAPDFPGEHDDAWWRGAGLCLLRAPAPGVDVDGAPTEWRVTSYMDGCGDGQAMEIVLDRPVQLNPVADNNDSDAPLIVGPDAGNRPAS
jgi:hypothetical protein